MLAHPAQSLYVVGAGGHGRELHSYLQDLRRAGWIGKLLGYVDDGVTTGQHGRLNVLGPIESLENLPAQYITAFGSNTLRWNIVKRITTRYGQFLQPWTLRHPRTHLGEDVEVGEGTCIAPGAIITTNTKIGSHCIVNVNASISHDCTIDDFVNINPGAIVCGTVNIGKGAYIGAGAVLRERISVGAWSTVGAGAVVIRDIPPNVTATGIPAQVIGEDRPHDV